MTNTPHARTAARFAVAPMMDWTDRPCRTFHRMLTTRAQIFTEMLTSAAVIHGDRDRLLGYDAGQQPLALQLGGADPAEMAEAARVGEEYGYQEININVGCPSNRVQAGRFGACLMREPELVAELVGAMKAAVSVAVTVKSRIGVDDQDPGPALDTLADKVFAAGCDGLWVHARKAWLKGLSPKENRDIPPLDHDRVYALKARLPHKWIGINGGIDSLTACREHLARVDGVMLGREAYQNPSILLGVDEAVFGAPARAIDYPDLRDRLVRAAEEIIARDGQVRHLARHLVGLFQGVPGARRFRRYLSENAMRDGAPPSVIADAIARVGYR